MENGCNDQELPHGLEATKRVKDLLHPFDQSLLPKLATGTNDKTLSNLHAANIQAGGFRCSTKAAA